jgi:hypothetical protein
MGRFCLVPYGVRNLKKVTGEFASQSNFLGYFPLCVLSPVQGVGWYSFLSVRIESEFIFVRLPTASTLQTVGREAIGAER